MTNSTELNPDFFTAPENAIARFATSSNHYRGSDLTIKTEAFVPFPHLRLSVFHVGGLQDTEIRGIGETYVVINGKGPYGHACVSSSEIFEIGLSLESDDTPPRHADIVGWPEDKSQQKLYALELREKATRFCLYVNPLGR